ncbi:hypothetical protein GF358_02555 [Candidatus Woesearchaeota archaeon]|nr:hypothetical protein [Candidatus Woesearchaeota archaeon]
MGFAEGVLAIYLYKSIHNLDIMVSVKKMRNELVKLINAGGNQDLIELSAASLKYINKYENTIRSLNNDKCTQGLLAVRTYATGGVAGKERKNLRSDINASLQRILEGLNELV